MPEAAFIKTACQSCDGRLELPMEAVGVTFACPRCGTQLELSLKCACQHCGNPLSFPQDYIGQAIECGHCHGETTLMPSALVVNDTADKPSEKPAPPTRRPNPRVKTSRETQPIRSKQKPMTPAEPVAKTQHPEPTTIAPPKRPNQGGPTPDAPPKRPNQGGPTPGVPPKRPNQGGPTPGAPPKRPNQGGPTPGAPPKRPNQGGPTPGAVASAPGAGVPAKTGETPQPQSSLQQKTELDENVGPLKKQTSVLVHLAKILLGFGLLGALTWFVILPLAGLGGSDLLFSREPAAPLPMFKPNPEALKVEGLKIEQGEFLTELKGTIRNHGKKPFRNVKITFRLKNKDNNPDQFSHTVNQDIEPGAAVQFTASISFEPATGATPEVLHIDSDEQLRIE